MTTLPVAWQHYLLIACIATFTLMNLLTSIQDDQKYTTGHGRINIWLLSCICILGATSTGGMTSQFFFLQYVLIVVSSFSLDIPAMLAQGLVILTAFLLQGFSGAEILTVEALIQMLSLVGFVPLLLVLSSRFTREEQNADRTTMMEQLLRTYEEEDQTILDTITAGVCILNHELCIEELSEAAAQMFGIEAQAAEGRPLNEIVTFGNLDHPEIEIGTGLLLSALYERTTISNVTCQLVCPSRKGFAIRLHIKPILGAADHVVGLLLVFEDAKCTLLFEQRHERP